MGAVVTRPILVTKILTVSPRRVTVKEDPTTPHLILRCLPSFRLLLPVVRIRLSFRNRQFKRSLRLLLRSTSLPIVPDQVRRAPN